MFADGNPDEQKKIGHLRPCHRRSEQSRVTSGDSERVASVLSERRSRIADEGLDRKAHRQGVVISPSSRHARSLTTECRELPVWLERTHAH